MPAPQQVPSFTMIGPVTDGKKGETEYRIAPLKGARMAGIIRVGVGLSSLRTRERREIFTPALLLWLWDVSVNGKVMPQILVSFPLVPNHGVIERVYSGPDAEVLGVAGKFGLSGGIEHSAMTDAARRIVTALGLALAPGYVTDERAAAAYVAHTRGRYERARRDADAAEKIAAEKHASYIAACERLAAVTARQPR